MNSIINSFKVVTKPLAWFFVCSVVGHPLITQAIFDDGLARQLESDVGSLMTRAQVPGASVAIVQNGRVVYAQGFGVREKGKPSRRPPIHL